MGGGRAEMGKLIKALKKQGFEVERTGSGHWKVTGPKGTTTLGFSPSSRGLKTSLQQLKKIGYKP